MPDGFQLFSAQMLLCQIPQAISLTLHSVLPKLARSSNVLIYNNFANCLVAINASTNFLLYWLPQLLLTFFLSHELRQQYHLVSCWEHWRSKHWILLEFLLFLQEHYSQLKKRRNIGLLWDLFWIRFSRKSCQKMWHQYNILFSFLWLP